MLEIIVVSPVSRMFALIVVVIVGNFKSEVYSENEESVDCCEGCDPCDYCQTNSIHDACGIRCFLNAVSVYHC